MGIFNEDIITKDPYDDYRYTSILFVKRQLLYGTGHVEMLNHGRYADCSRLMSERANSCVNHEYNLSHSVKEEHISIHPLGNFAQCKYFQIESCIITLDDCQIKLYSMCFCIKPDMFGYQRVVWEDEVRNDKKEENNEFI